MKERPKDDPAFPKVTDNYKEDQVNMIVKLNNEVEKLMGY